MSHPEFRFLPAACACLLMLAACTTVAPPAPAPSPESPARPVAQLNNPAIVGDLDTTPLMEPGVQILSQDGGMSDAAVGRAIASKLRANLVMPRGNYPRNASVTLEAMLTPSGSVLGARVARGSGHKAVDEAVLKALRRAEPLPVPQSIAAEDRSQRITLVFHPFQ